MILVLMGVENGKNYNFNNCCDIGRNGKRYFLQKRNRSIDEKSFVIEYTIFAKIFMGIIIACILLFIFVDFLSSDNFLQNWSKYILVEGMIILVFAICSYSCSKIYVEFGISQIIIQPIIRGKKDIFL